MSNTMSQIWHDAIDALERAIAPKKHLLEEDQAAFDSAVKQLRDQADAEIGHLIGDAESAGKSALGQVEADAAPLVDEAKADASDLAHTAEADVEQVVSSDSAPAPTTQPEQASTPETAA